MKKLLRKKNHEILYSVEDFSSLDRMLYMRTVDLWQIIKDKSNVKEVLIIIIWLYKDKNLYDHDIKNAEFLQSNLFLYLNYFC